MYHTLDPTGFGKVLEVGQDTWLGQFSLTEGPAGRSKEKLANQTESQKENQNWQTSQPPPTKCSFAESFRWNLAISCSFAHH